LDLGGDAVMIERQLSMSSAMPSPHLPAARLPADCADLGHVRTEIDRVDAALVKLIGERFGYVERAWQIKLVAKQEANVPWRNQQVIDKVRARATEAGVPPDLCEALWRQMIGWFIQYEEEKLGRDLEADGAASGAAGGKSGGKSGGSTS
jgi:isochorismate pyruvate lyase